MECKKKNRIENQIPSKFKIQIIKIHQDVYRQDTYLPASIPQDNELAIKGSLILLITMGA
jgi:hypothetical protein